jgi:hypothetical protein
MIHWVDWIGAGENMNRLIKKLFSAKPHPVKKAARPVKPGQAPLIVSFDGRVMRLRLPEH